MGGGALLGGVRWGCERAGGWIGVGRVGCRAGWVVVLGNRIGGRSCLLRLIKNWWNRDFVEVDGRYRVWGSGDVPYRWEWEHWRVEGGGAVKGWEDG